MIYAANTIESVIPESCTSFSEMADYISIYAKDEFNNLLESIGLEEYTEFNESGILTMHEGINLVELKDKIKNKFKNIFGVIKSFWKKVLAQFAVSNKRTASYFGKVNIDSIPDKNYGKTHEFKNIGKIDYAKNAEKFITQVDKVYKGLMAHGYDEQKLNQAMSKLDTAIIPAISTVAGDNRSLMKSNLKDKLIGEEIEVNKAWIKNNRAKIGLYIDAGNSVKHIKDAYKNEAKFFNDAWTEIDKLEGTEFNDLCVRLVAIMAEVVSITHKCYSIEADAYRRRFTEYRSIATKVIRAAGILKEDVEEDFGELGVTEVDMVDRAFNF